MKGIIITSLIILAYAVFIAAAINFLSGVFSRRNQRKLRHEAGEKIVDLFRAGDEIRRRKAMAAIAAEKPQEQLAQVNGQPLQTAAESETPPQPPTTEIDIKVQQPAPTGHVDRMA